jgi:DNA polymerase-3 subunit epsilon
MREIVFDTETTGLDPASGDRVVEIGCLELVNRLPSGETFHVYINPERDMPKEAEAVHGLSAAFLKDKPVFAEVAEAFLTFVGDAPLIAHNASFDMKFINAELRLCGRADLAAHKVIDTLALARQKFPGAPASLDALCRRFGVDNSNRDLHGALIDSELLAGVYLELSGGRQPGLVFEAASKTRQKTNQKAGQQSDDISGSPGAESIGTSRAGPQANARQPQRRRETTLPPRLSDEERAAHMAFLKNLPQRALWLRDEGEL